MGYVVFVKPKDLALRWSISLSAVYARKAGVSKLTPIYLDGSLRFKLSEIERIESDLSRQGERFKVS